MAAYARLQCSLLCQRPFCVVRKLGRRVRKRAGHDGKGKERKRDDAPAFFLFPSTPARLLCYFHWDAQREPRRRRDWPFSGPQFRPETSPAVAVFSGCLLLLVVVFCGLKWVFILIDAWKKMECFHMTSRPPAVELIMNFFLMYTLFFAPINLRRSWPLDCKRSTQIHVVVLKLKRRFRD